VTPEKDRTVPADRYVAAQAWWIASEVVRRNPSLRIAETSHDEVGSSLAIYDPANSEARQFLLNRVAGCNIVGDPLSHIGWDEIFEASSPHDIVKRVEDGLMLAPSSPAPPTDHATIVYRVIARILSGVVNDRHSWMVRGQRPEDPSVHESLTWAGDVTRFPSVNRLHIRWFEYDALEGEDQGVNRLWALWRDLQPVALFDMFGDVHTVSGNDDLLAAYRASGHNLGLAMASTLGQILP
jgi:hypothetical protein